MFQDQEKISRNQALMLVLAGGIGNIFVVLATPAVKDAGRDAVSVKSYTHRNLKSRMR